MATQAQLLSQTLDGIAKLRERVPGYSSASECEDDLRKPTNRGNKLKRKANLVHEGQIYGAEEPLAHKRKIFHAGHEVNIIGRKPQRFDEDGRSLDSDEADENADADAALHDPYHGIEIDKIFRPLTAAAELPDHPAMALPYTSKILDGIIQQTSDMLFRERKALWHAKYLMTDLRGDGSWLPCGLFSSKKDDSTFDTETLYTTDIAQEIRRIRPSNHHKRHSNGEIPAVKKKLHVEGVNGITDERDVSADQPIEHGALNSMEIKNDGIEEKRDEAKDPDQGASSKIPGLEYQSSFRSRSVNNNLETPDFVSDIADVSRTQNIVKYEPSRLARAPQRVRQGSDENIAIGEDLTENRSPEVVPDEEINNTASQVVPHRMTTRAQAQAASDQHSSTRTHTPSTSVSDPPYVHPLFVVQQRSRSDLTFGLNPDEAEQIRFLLSIYVQKQDEIVRGAAKLLHGLLKAHRLRSTVYRWCKAEAHVGRMSDGEDWYDMEEWGLDEPLVKGVGDEEEEVGQGKKTRARRAA